MKKIIFIVLGIFLVLGVLVGVGAVSLLNNNTNKFVCESDIGGITLMYTETDLVGYTTSGELSYDLDEQKVLAEELGIEEYLVEFNTWFETETSGSCIKE
ncbi:hypothetical protein K8R20_01450 [bacterium]|nr:hypothetical protein [bacterium]